MPPLPSWARNLGHQVPQATIWTKDISLVRLTETSMHCEETNKISDKMEQYASTGTWKVTIMTRRSITIINLVTWNQRSVWQLFEQHVTSDFIQNNTQGS